MIWIICTHCRVGRTRFGPICHDHLPIEPHPHKLRPILIIDFGVVCQLHDTIWELVSCFSNFRITQPTSLVTLIRHPHQKYILDCRSHSSSARSLGNFRLLIPSPAQLLATFHYILNTLGPHFVCPRRNTSSTFRRSSQSRFFLPNSAPIKSVGAIRGILSPRISLSQVHNPKNLAIVLITLGSLLPRQSFQYAWASRSCSWIFIGRTCRLLNSLESIKSSEQII